MTPFETEFLAINAAALWVAAAALVAQVVIGAGQIAVVWHGIRSMIASGQARACEHDQRHEEAMRKYDQRHEETMRMNDQRHEETMTALRALITRTVPQPGTPNN
ncbi:MAG: hypothetical protein F4X81_00225 [Gammaproteobacteria bacterium]|nr:hypothetical protein [Gammaproteobacteria bacterium]MYE49874.1 hypothetical protein [Gammaproteobacteria bacterium]MYF51181.1 hypothetical protein [Gammaproteobacteria bacterium]